MSVPKLLDLVALRRDIPEHRLCTGDVGTVVEVLDSAIVAEFIEASGDTRAVITLPVSDVRRLDPHDMLAVRAARPGT